MKTHHVGFVLFTMLLMVSVIMIFTLTQWQGLILLQRLMNKAVEHSNRLSDFEKAFDAIQSNLNYDLTKEQVGQLVWKGTLMKFKMTSMGDFPCIQRMIGGKPFSTIHYQIKLWLDENPQHSLEVRLARPTTLKPCLNPRWVNSNILSWNYRG